MHALCNTGIMQHMHYASCEFCITCIMERVHQATYVLSKTCIMQHVQHAWCKVQEFPHLHYGSEEGPTLWIVPHLRGERGRVSCHSFSSLEGGALPEKRLWRTLKTLYNFKGLFEIFPYLRYFLVYRFFLSLKDFLN